LVTDYLSDEWFAQWKIALEACKELGMGCHIYDENSFPSGFAGGHVMASNPLAANSLLTGRLVTSWLAAEERAHGRRLAVLGRDRADGTVRAVSADEATDCTPEDPRIFVSMEKKSASLWKAGFPMTDVCRPEVTREFLRVTHAAYAARFPDDLGAAIRYVFTDEPETGVSPRGFHLSQASLGEFHRDHGYRLETRLDALCGANADSPAVRHDYFLTLNRLFTRHFARACHDWCDGHGTSFTGHFLENNWPIPVGSPSTMAAMRWMHAPGIDLLGFQFSRATLRGNAHWLLTVKEATSIAAQCGRGEVFCESCGGGGYAFGPIEMKPLEDFLLALGVNRFTPHLSHASLAGARKYDWPQTLTPHSPWWDALGSHLSHVARTNHLLSLGSTRSRVLVLHPTTTGWLHYRPACFRWPDEPPETSLERLRKSHGEFLAGLYSAQVDFDLGDESVMAEMGSAAGGLLKIGCCSYETVVVPAGMENFLDSTVRLLENYLRSGGEIVCVGEPPGFVDGRPARCPLQDHSGWKTVDGDPVEFLRARHAPRLSGPDGAPLPPDLLWRHSELPDGGAVVFFSNPTRSPIAADVVVRGSGIVGLDTQSGEHFPLACAEENGCVRSRVELLPGGHALWWVPASRPAGFAIPEPRHWHPIPAVFESSTPLDPNVLPLDYCDYHGPQGSLKNVPTLAADTANWHAQGFDQNLWRVSIQFRKTFLDAEISDHSAMSVTHRFRLSESFHSSASAGSLEVAVERPWLYDIFCNGVRIPQVDAKRWFDDDMRLLPLGSSPVPGENLIELRASRFHVLAEIMPVILRGDFRAVPTKAGFLIEPTADWKSGADWRAEGYSFYPWKARYRYAFGMPRAGSVRVSPPEFSGSAAGVSVDGAPPVWLPADRSPTPLPGPLGPGNHRLDILLCGNLKNLLGPHFCDGLPGAWSWEDCPSVQPPGDQYRLARTGLTGHLAVEISG
jgi:hypothetical protein